MQENVAGRSTYAWNYENQPSSITVGGVAETYLYDADNERVKRTRSGVSTYYIGGVYEVETGGITRTYYQFNGKVVAQRQNVPIPPTPTNTPTPTRTPTPYDPCANLPPGELCDARAAGGEGKKPAATFTATQGKGSAATATLVSKSDDKGSAGSGVAADSVLPPYTTSTLVYLHGDHLGSVSVSTSSAGAKLNEQKYDPWGKLRTAVLPQTDINYTGQHRDDTGLLYYHARYYDPSLARFISPDSIVPGASSVVGGAGRIGQWQNSKLTVDFHESEFAASLQQEHALILNKGFWFQLSDQDRSQAGKPWGSENPQTLGRYTYVLNNPARLTDPTGHKSATGELSAGAGGGSAAVVMAIIALLYYDAMTNQVYSTPKPLTDSERKHIERIEAIPEFLRTHPDIAKEAAILNNGGSLPAGMDHVGEAREMIRSLQKAIRTLLTYRKYRDADGQAEIDKAVEEAQKYVEELNEAVNAK